MVLLLIVTSKESQGNYGKCFLLLIAAFLVEKELKHTVFNKKIIGFLRKIERFMKIYKMNYFKNSKEGILEYLLLEIEQIHLLKKGKSN